MPKKDMYIDEDELRDYEYEDIYEKKQKRRKIIGIIILILLILFGIFMFIKTYFSGTEVIVVSENEKTLLQAGKNYFKKNYEELPSAEGTCSEVSLEKILLEGLLKKNNFKNCHGKNTKVKVCILENGKEHWTPFLTCDEINTEFTNWKKGTIQDLTPNQSDVKFEFLGQVLEADKKELGDTELYWEEDIPYDAYRTNEVTEYYKYRDKYYIWDLNEKRYYPGNKTNASSVKEYYVSSPAEGYIYKDSATNNASKYYKDGSKIYWNNGAYSMSSPGNGYVYKDSGVNVHAYRTRTWTKTSDLPSPTLRYVCGAENRDNVKNSFKPCDESDDEYTILKDTYYSCDGVNKVSKDSKCHTCSSGVLRKDNSSCGYYSEWSKYTSKSCDASSDLCDVLIKSTYKWYKYSKSYYKTDTLYTSAPQAGYYKDSATTTTAYKWYKLVKIGETRTLNKIAPNKLATYTEKTEWGPWTTYSLTKPAGSLNTEVKSKKKVAVQKVIGDTKNNWKDLSNSYVSESELIKLFNDKKLDVKTLEDIKNINGEAKYKINMYYRDRK